MEEASLFDHSRLTAAIEAVMHALREKRTAVARRMKANAALLAIAIFCAGAGLFFCELALFDYLETIYNPPLAALFSAIIAFVETGIALSVRYWLRNRRKTSAAAAEDELSRHLHALLKGLGDDLEEPVRENPKTAVALAATAGLLAARRL